MIDAQSTNMLSLEESLYHLCHHLTTLGQNIRLIAIADIRFFLHRYASDLDWSLIKQDYPFVISTLSLLNLLVPLDTSIKQQYLQCSTLVPAAVGMDYKGWPQQSTKPNLVNNRDIFIICKDTFLPPEWWLRLSYGLGLDGSTLFGYWVKHPMRIFKIGSLWLLNKI